MSLHQGTGRMQTHHLVGLLFLFGQTSPRVTSSLDKVSLKDCLCLQQSTGEQQLGPIVHTCLPSNPSKLIIDTFHLCNATMPLKGPHRLVNSSS